ncbi:MAG: magnesium transporter CorA family protein [Candidatus Moranbacteria bacterium]|nr:magnesium transporter CorA family protein [Candidatus Moranbacteria bacterium]
MRSIKHNGITWIDCEDPGADDILYIQENFDIHPLAIEEFTTPTFRPKVTKYTNCLFLTIHIPLYDSEEKTTYPGELDIVITEDHLITGHRKSIYQLTNFFETLATRGGKRRLHMNGTPTHLLYDLLEILLESCFPRLDHVTEKIDHIEHQIFRGNEKKMVREISVVKRDVLNFRRTLKPQRSILESLSQTDSPLVSKELKPYFHDLVGTNIRLWNTLESNKETIESLEETNNTLFSHKINEKMRFLTLFSVILIPMTLYANILGMNVPSIPFGTSSNAFFLHTGLSIGVSIVTAIIFKWRKWI